MLRAVPLLLLPWLLPCISAGWREQHVVTGLPTLNGPDLTSYAGVVPVRKDYIRDIEVPQSHMSANAQSGLFYWLFEAEEPLQEHPPLMLWVQGGPGSSSGVGLFYEVFP